MGPDDAPACSIVMAAYNRGPMLFSNLISLSRQQCPVGCFEVVLVDDGSTDGTGQMVRSLRTPFALRYIHKANENSRARTRNIGIHHARGRVILFVDAEMLCPPGFVAAHLRLHDAYGPCVVAGWHDCLAERVRTPLPADWPARVAGAKITKSCRPGINTGDGTVPFITANCSCPRADLYEVGLFDESFVGYGHEDLDLGLRLRLLGRRFVSSGGTLCYHQPHPPSPGQKAEVCANIARYLRKHHRPRRVLHLAGSMIAGGIERYLTLLASSLHGGQHSFTVVATEEPEHFQDDFARLGVELLRRSPEDIGGYLRDNRFDVIHIHTPGQWLPHIGLSPEATPVVATVHSPLRQEPLPAPHRVVCVSEGLARWQPGRRSDYRVIAPGVDLQAFVRRGRRSQARETLGIPRTAFCMGAIGRMADDRISARMFGLLLQVLRQAPAAFLLVLGTGPLREAHQQAVRAWGLEARVRLPGAVDCVAEYLEAVDVLAQATEGETFGLATLEALAEGVPVVTGYLAGSAETVVDGECGFLCRNAEQFVQRVLQFARGEHDLLGFSTKAMQRAKLFDCRRTALRHKLLYDEVTEGARYWWPEPAEAARDAEGLTGTP